MTIFLIAAALLTAAALLFVLPPLLQKQPALSRHALRSEVNLGVLRDQLRELDADLAAGSIDAQAYQSARHELEHRVAEEVQPAMPYSKSAFGERWSAMGVGLSLPVLAVALYYVLGTPAGFAPAGSAADAPAQEQQSHALTDAQIQDMVGGLAERLKKEPGDVEGWSMLARSYGALSRFSESAAAYAQLVKLVPDDADILADYADTLAMAQNRSLQGEPERLVQRALAVDPNNIKALALAGSGAFERRDYQGAIGQWNKILGLVGSETDIARSTAGSIAEAKSMLGTPAAAQQAAPAAQAQQLDIASDVGGTVEIAPALRAKVSGEDALFIFARSAEGPRFPLAVLRKQVKDLPVRFVLDDSMSMTPEATLSAHPMVVVGARISKSGSATPSAGDLEGMTGAVRHGSQGLSIVIDTQRK